LQRAGDATESCDKFNHMVARIKERYCPTLDVATTNPTQMPCGVHQRRDRSGRASAI
jgi:hypothetical protein